jgi:hypothetical protein
MIKRLKSSYAVSILCKALDISRSGYYAWLRGRPNIRVKEDVKIREAILISHKNAPSNGLDNIHADVRETIRCSRKRVHRLMREMGVRSCRKRPFRVHTTNSRHEYSIAPNLVKNLTISHPNQVWVCDITYIPTAEGFLYLAAVKDKFTREIVGYSTSDQITSLMAQEALVKAVNARKPAAGLIHHSDRAVQYCCHAYRDLLKQYKIDCSMGKKGTLRFFPLRCRCLWQVRGCMFCRTHYNDTALFHCGSSRICSAGIRIRIAGISSAFPIPHYCILNAACPLPTSSST